MSHVEEGNAAEGVPQLETSIELVAELTDGGMSGRYGDGSEVNDGAQNN